MSFVRKRATHRVAFLFGGERDEGRDKKRHPGVRKEAGLHAQREGSYETWRREPWGAEEILWRLSQGAGGVRHGRQQVRKTAGDGRPLPGLGDGGPHVEKNPNDL